MFDFKPEDKKNINSEPAPKIEVQSKTAVTSPSANPTQPTPTFNTQNVKVHAMPNKFLSNRGAKRTSALPGARTQPASGSGFKKSIIIGVIVGVIVLCLLGLGGWFLIKTIQTPAPNPNLDSTTPAFLENNVAEPESEPEPEPEPQEICSADNCGACLPAQCNILEPDCHLEDRCLRYGVSDGDYNQCPDYICLFGPVEEDEEEEEESENQGLMPGPDSDSDLLTDVEEGVWAANPLKDDTDSDGYKDGEEIKNFYDPSSPGRKLGDSGLINNFSNPDYGYTIYYPSFWMIEGSESNPDRVRFKSSTGEFIQVIVQENYGGFLTAKEWYLTQNPNVSENELEEILIGNWSGIQSPDKLNSYLVNNNYIYTITYNIGLKTELNYSTTYQVMLESFRLFESL